MLKWLRIAVSLLGAWLAAQAGNDFRFSIIGDRTGGAVPGVWEQTWREADALRPDFVITIGDAIEGRKDDAAEQEWNQIRQFLAGYRRYPIYLVAGNHDIWNARSRELFERAAGRRASYSFRRQDALFVVLDNSGGFDLPADQLQFLERELQANPKLKPKFVFFHQPCWLLALKMGSGDFALHQLARKHGVDFIFSGHVHSYAKVVRDGVTYIQVGSSGARIKPDFDAGAFYQHLLAEVKGGEVKITVHELGPPYGQGRSFAAVK